MTRSNLRRRIENIEARLPPEPILLDPNHVQRMFFLTYCAVYYLDDLTPGDSISLEAVRRVLAYDPHHHKLLAKFGVSWKHDPKQIARAFRRMIMGLSESFRQDLYEILEILGVRFE